MQRTRTTNPSRPLVPLLGLAALTLFSLAGTQPTQAQTTIDTTPQSTGQSSIIAWGVTNTSTYGQTFVAPTDNVLNNFTFYLGPQFSGSGPIQYQADVYAWDGTKASGLALFTSATQTYTPVSSGYAPVFTSTGSTILTAGQQYVTCLTTAGLQNGRPDSTISWKTTDGFQDAYSGGQFVFINAGNDASQLTTSQWESFGTGDLAFKMNFSPSTPASAAPEPSEYAGLGFAAFGLLALGLNARRKRSAGLLAA